MNNFLNEYFGFSFEWNIELNHFLARFNEKMNIQNVSARARATPTLHPLIQSVLCSQHGWHHKATTFPGKAGGGIHSWEQSQQLWDDGVGERFFQGKRGRILGGWEAGALSNGWKRGLWWPR